MSFKSFAKVKLGYIYYAYLIDQAYKCIKIIQTSAI